MVNKLVVMAVDDHVQQLSEFKAMLGQTYDLRVVKSASEAISFLNKAHVDVILLDIDMPNISGFEFLQDIRRLPSYKLRPIIVVSGNSGVEFNNRAREYGADAVLGKPVNPTVLMDIIDRTHAEYIEKTEG